MEKFYLFATFCAAVEKVTFDNRLNNYLKTLKKGTIFKYRGYDFCNDKTIRKKGKVVVSFNLNEYQITKDYKKIVFQEGALKFNFHDQIGGIFCGKHKLNEMVNLCNRKRTIHWKIFGFGILS